MREPRLLRVALAALMLPDGTFLAYVITLVMASPLLLMVLNAFKTEADAFSVPPKRSTEPVNTS